MIPRFHIFCRLARRERTERRRLVALQRRRTRQRDAAAPEPIPGNPVKVGLT
jgi:hypothetical protein